MSSAIQADLRARSPEQSLWAIGVRCTVDVVGNLAVVIPAPGERALEDAGVRHAVLAALRSFGFTHAAVEPSDAQEPPALPDAPIA